MRVALLADIHSNLPALEAALSAAKKHHLERIISLGDQVNLGPMPRETLSLLRVAALQCAAAHARGYHLPRDAAHRPGDPLPCDAGRRQVPDVRRRKGAAPAARDAL